MPRVPAKIISRQPAVRCQDTLPRGNGPDGDVACGRVRAERILLNRDAHWLLGENRPVSIVANTQDAPQHRRMSR